MKMSATPSPMSGATASMLGAGKGISVLLLAGEVKFLLARQSFSVVCSIVDTLGAGVPFFPGPLA
jgi:hypothetical protein